MTVGGASDSIASRRSAGAMVGAFVRVESMGEAVSFDCSGCGEREPAGCAPGERERAAQTVARLRSDQAA